MLFSSLLMDLIRNVLEYESVSSRISLYNIISQRSLQDNINNVHLICLVACSEGGRGGAVGGGGATCRRNIVFMNNVLF